MATRRLLIALLITLIPAVETLALDIPRLQARVTDLAGVLATDQVAQIEAKLRNLEETDSTQIAVLIIPSLEGESPEDYSERVATAWRLGQKGRDNGALLLIAMKERKIRIEVGYGLEPTLTDARSRRIIQDEIAPAFIQGDFYRGIDSGVTALIQTVRGVYQPASGGSEAPRSRPAARTSYDWLIFLLFPLLWVLGSTGKWGGGILGAGAGTYFVYSMVHALMLSLLLGGLIGALAGAFIGTMVRAGARASKRGGGGFGGPFMIGGGGGFSGGGGSFGGGGGFSGGGGSFGGGGASGSW
jgi:uncharacterized protein